MTNSLTMFKLETMIYASEDGTNSVFTLNSALQKQLDALATQHPEVCQRKARGEAGGVTYQVRGAALAIQPVRGIDLLWKNNLQSATVSLQVIIGLCKHKEAAALKIEPPLQNGRADMSAIRRLFSFVVVR